MCPTHTPTCACSTIAIKSSLLLLPSLPPSPFAAAIGCDASPGPLVIVSFPRVPALPHSLTHSCCFLIEVSCLLDCPYRPCFPRSSDCPLSRVYFDIFVEFLLAIFRIHLSAVVSPYCFIWQAAAAMDLSRSLGVVVVGIF